MRIYNLFPLLAGPFSAWQPHLKRAAALGFDWVFVNPIQKPGASGSLYSIADYFDFHPSLIDPKASISPREQVRAAVVQAERLGLRMMIDLVLNHCAIDAPLVQQHPEWFLQEGGQVANAFCVEADGNRIVWEDLAQFDHSGTKDPEGLFTYFVAVVEFLIALGFQGFRCDAAYQVPRPFWERLIAQVRQRHPEVRFVAETLGCTPEQTLETASAGFDAIFNSAKWWDFQSPWLLEQYELTRQLVPSIAFPESHDTERLYAESGQNVHALKQRYLFTALFSAGVMMPIGYEFGFRRRLHVVHSRPQDWEEPAVDLRSFIAKINRIKQDYPLFQEEALIQRLEHPNPQILLLWRASTRGQGEALLILNKDPNHPQSFFCEDLYRHIQAPPPLIDLSPEWAMDYLPTPFHFELGPGMGRVLWAAAGD